MTHEDPHTDLKGVINAILESLNDHDATVNEALQKSLLKIAINSNVNVVLSTFCDFLNNNARTNVDHTGNILCGVEQICIHKGQDIDAITTDKVLDVVIKEMTINVDYIPCMQIPASGILACIGTYQCEKVMAPLMELLMPNVVPHYTVPHTIGSIARLNIKGIVPFVKKILGKMLPTLSLIKQDHVRQAYSYAFASLTMALIDFFNNELENEINVINKDNFKAEFSMVYDVLCNNWLHSSEPRVVETILSALGPMINLISFEKHTELMPKLIQNILNLYKKSNIDLFHVTEALACILKKTVSYEDFLTPGTIDIICGTIFNYVVTIPDYDQPKKVKNNFEVLRCFDILFNYSNSTLNYLYQRTKSSNEEDRMKSIAVFTHLLTFSDKMIIDNFISTLIDLINVENTIKMKRILLKAIVALADKNASEFKNYSTLLEFILKNINNTQSNETIELYNDCENSLYLLSSTVNGIKQSLWPILLKALMVSKHIGSVGIITKSLINLLQIPNAPETNELNVSNESIFVRCISVLNVKNVNMNVKDLQSVINFLLKYCAIIHKDLAVNWEVDLKNLSSYLNSNDVDDATWESMLIDLFRSAIYVVNDNHWIENISQKILEQIPSSEHSVTQKGILYKILGVLLCNMVDVSSIEYRLDIYFRAIPNVDMDEGKYISEALGIASVKHGIRIVEKLDDLSKGILTRKTTRFLKFNFMKHAKNDAAMDNMKYIITICYGQISKEIIDLNLLNKLVKPELNDSGTAIRWIIDILQNTTSSPSLINAALETLDLFTKSVHLMLHSNIILQEKIDMLDLILITVIDRVSNNFDLELFPTIIKTITSMINQPKYLTPNERNKILRILISKIIVYIRSIKAKCDPPIDPKMQSDMIKNIQKSFDLLVKDFIVQITCPSTLDDILSIMDPWMNNQMEDVRIFVMRSNQSVLSAFIQNINLTYENPSRFNQSGLILGRMLSKSADMSLTVRTISVECIKILIQIIDLYEGRITSPGSENLKNLEIGLISDDSELFAKTLANVVNIICDKIQHHQIMLLIESLLSNLEMNNSTDQECCITLNLIFKNKGQDLHQHVNEIMTLILNTVKHVNVAKKERLLNAFISLTKHHPKAVVEFLLSQPLPYEIHVIDCWRILTEDPSITLTTVEHFMKILSTQPIYEENPSYDIEKVASVQCLAVISALCEILSQPQTKAICNEIFADIFSTLFITLFCFIGSVPPAHAISLNKKQEKFGFIPNNQSTKISPVRLAVDALKALLISFGCVKIFDLLLLCNEMDSASFVFPFLDYIAGIVKIFCEDYPQYLLKLVKSLNQHARAHLIPQRLAVVAFFSHLVSYGCNDNAVLLETVIATLNAGWQDSALEVRAISLSGLGNVKYLKKEQRDPLLQSVLEQSYRGLEDIQGINPRTNIPLVSMMSLTDYLSREDENNHMTDSFIPIAHRIKAFMNTDNAILREASIRLFGEIVHKRKSDSLNEQAFILFPCFLLHLADVDVNVVKACKQTLRKIAPSFQAPLTNAMIQKHMIDTANLHIADFLTDLIKCIGKELPMNVHQMIESTTNYLNSPWDEIRGYASIMIGLLFANYDKKCIVENDHDKAKKALTLRLIQLIKDKNPSVRIAAASGLSGVYQNT